jgi:hypothetical protein
VCTQNRSWRETCTRTGITRLTAGFPCSNVTLVGFTLEPSDQVANTQLSELVKYASWPTEAIRG